MLSGAGFILSVPGILKIVSLLCITIGGSIFAAFGECTESIFWTITYIASSTMSVVLSIISYAVYAADLVKSPLSLKTLHIAEIASSYMLFFLLLIVSIVKMTQCSSRKYTIDHVSESITIVGAIMLAIGGTLLFLDWYSSVRVDDNRTNATSQTENEANSQHPRKSIMV
ncbi:uncharacterized protein LOC129778526 [Toxorhynchites rutilus septentrionalis]|uniref:uncharacterized protein LOC129778526 n=1 Tax=Toxorhynchites rutilus septentrionalis TaxID=329112 RepID=UPI00247AE4E3|nr:uncharacterized protein LOC129778526 [Toxorhynchites rutilus septentrionalis]